MGNFLRTVLRLLGLSPAIDLRSKYPREIVIVGGYGYGNTGDEAQLGANLARWRLLCPEAECLVLSPNPKYTHEQHGCRTGHASRVVFFGANRSTHYMRSSRWFRLTFWFVLLRLEVSASFLRAGLPALFASAAEGKLLGSLQNASLLHVSGGGFLTGPTRSRLWDTCLLLRLCRRLDTPYLLTGQTIGLFENVADRWLARTGLVEALLIGLRDPGESAVELRQLGIDGEHVVSTYDDALFCDKSDEAALVTAFRQQGLPTDRPYLAINFHWWGMSPDTQTRSTERLGEVLKATQEKYDVALLLVPMVPSDMAAQRALAALMPESRCAIFDYAFQYPLVRAVIGRATALISFKHHPIVFALGESVPCLSLSLDKYYDRKNYGAMANFRQEDFCLHSEDFFGGRFEQMLDRLFAEHHAIAASIGEQLVAARGRQAALFEQAARRAGLII